MPAEEVSGRVPITDRNRPALRVPMPTRLPDTGNEAESEISSHQRETTPNIAIKATRPLASLSKRQQLPHLSDNILLEVPELGKAIGAPSAPPSLPHSHRSSARHPPAGQTTRKRELSTKSNEIRANKKSKFSQDSGQVSNEDNGKLLVRLCDG